MRTYIGAAALVIAAIIASLAAFAGTSYADEQSGEHANNYAEAQQSAIACSASGNIWHAGSDSGSRHDHTGGYCEVFPSGSGGVRVYAIHWDHAHPAQRTCGSLPGYSGGPDICVPISLLATRERDSGGRFRNGNDGISEADGIWDAVESYIAGQLAGS